MQPCEADGLKRSVPVSEFSTAGRPERLRIDYALPASAPTTDEPLLRGIAALESRGVRVVGDPEYSIARYGYLAGTDVERTAEFNSLLRNANVQTIVCGRGGYGTLRLLEDVDYQAARQHRPVVVGYSDITALQLALYTKSGVSSLSGPMLAVEWGGPNGIDPETERLFWQALDATESWELQNPGGRAMGPLSPVTKRGHGTAEGTLLGGNLAVLTKLVGSPYLPDMRGAILFLEDVAEPPYRIDGYLAQLKLAGVLDGLAGVVLGEFSEADPEPGKPSLELEQVFADYLLDLGCPIATGLVYGHVPRKTTVPIGVHSRLAVDEDGATLTVLETLRQTI